MRCLAILGFPARGANLPRLLAQSAVAVPLTGTLTETTLATIAIPAGAMGINGGIRLRAWFTCTNSANNKTFTVKLGATTVRTSTRTTVAQQAFFFDVINRGAANAQMSSIPADGTGSAVLTYTMDTSVAQNLTITGTLANTGETITLEGYAVDILNP